MMVYLKLKSTINNMSLLTSHLLILLLKEADSILSFIMLS